MPEDTFFTQENCDRCGGKLDIRTMSWFTNETICVNCDDGEQEMKARLDDPNKYEGCGFLPF